MKQTVLYWLITYISWFYGRLFFDLEVVFDFDEKEYFSKSQDPVIIAPNHVSYFDPPLISGVWPNPLHFFAGSHLFQKSKWFAWILKQLHSHPVNRDNGVSAVKEAVRLVMKEKLSIVIFPEGTRSHDGVLQSLQDGVAFIALKSGANIIPTYILGTYEAWPKKKRYPKLFGKIIVRFGGPISSTEVQMREDMSTKEKIAYINHKLHESLLQLQKAVQDMK